MVSNEVYTGAGLSATLIPEMEFDVGQAFGTGGFLAINTTESQIDLITNAATKYLVSGIYKGCMAKVTVYDTNGAEKTAETIVMIKDNGFNYILFNYDLATATHQAAGYKVKCVILPYGTPVYSPNAISGKHSLLADNWLGLVNTIAPPTVDVDNRQLGLALGGTRNFGYQFKVAETLGDASIDVAFNNASWLYYVLGKQAITVTTVTGNAATPADGGIYFKTDDSVIYRAEEDVTSTPIVSVLPPLPNGATASQYDRVDRSKNIAYVFSEMNGGLLPSFALEISTEKNNVGLSQSGTESVFTRIFTGCQVDTFTLNFEEGMEVKASITAKSKYAHDSEDNYVAKRNVTINTNLFNYYSESPAATINSAINAPFMFSDGTIEIFGQTLARVKSGSIVISNALMPHRFIGNYDRKMTSAHIPGQRTYEVQLNLLITDRTVWNELRKADEIGSSEIKITFEKPNGEKMHIYLENYAVTSVDIPFPEDKSTLEVALSVSARSLSACEYLGKWVIQG